MIRCEKKRCFADLESRARRRLGLRVEGTGLAGDIGGPQSGVEIVVDDLEGAGIGVVDADLLRGQLVLDEFVFDAFVGKRPRRVEAERFEVARQHLHRGDTAGLDRLDELGAGREREIVAAPEPEPLRIGEIVHRRRAGRGDVDDPRVGERVLQPQSGAPLLRRHLLAALALAAGGVRHRMAFVEHDDPIEIGAHPIDDLPDARNPILACVGAQRGVGRK